jgi:cytochrome c biogenesis protein CcmG/thiol:disulfide interchange protein DsbE
MAEDTAPALLRFGLPLGVFLALVVLLAIGLNLNPREVPSPLIDKPAPAFELPRLHAPDQTFSSQSMKGQVWILNVWASWCVACREEHRVLVDLAKRGVVPILGLNYKDRREDALGWLQHLGDPYRISLVDLDGKVGIDYGVYGVPETYVIDRAGVIRYKRIGPVTPEILQQKILPLISELKRG